MEQDYTEKFQEQKDLLNQYKRGAVAQIPLMAQEIGHAQSEYTLQKQGIINTISEVSSMNNELNEKTTLMADEIRTKEDTIRKLREQLKKEKEIVGQERTLGILRKEQAESLEHKYDGNYHSSWMGLYRPLKETSRFALLVVSVLFCILVVCILVYAYQKGFLQRIPVPGFLKKNAFE